MEAGQEELRRVARPEDLLGREADENELLLVERNGGGKQRANHVHEVPRGGVGVLFQQRGCCHVFAALSYNEHILFSGRSRVHANRISYTLRMRRKWRCREGLSDLYASKARRI